MGPAYGMTVLNDSPTRMSRDGGDMQHIQRRRRALVQSVALVFEIDEHQLGMATRGKAPIARARQVAMYMAHVTWCMSLTDVGRLFGRDRTTVAHACEAIEDLRDDPSFDRRLDLLEQAVRSLAEASAVPPMVA